ncbi:hypothetical protein CASFOL_026524 [Castilleja foliolosa]|uniref:KIB1-4 beta-propeller domain-containing protein n=1 Tax=Castilleja foliolosa TaxID=1961234 RepID=A0ABD3CIJ4_9LAMI
MASSSSSYSVMLRLICSKGIFGSSSNYCIFGKWSARSCASRFNRRALCTATNSSPWLMLPPKSKFKADTMSCEFYSLANNKVQTHCFSDEIHDLRLTTCRGSSHGWLALLSHDGFFLYNPISRRHIKLPSILNLPTDDPYEEFLKSARSVTKVILSCSPDEDEDNCRVLIVRGWDNAPAFCCPGRSKEWTVMLGEQSGRKRFYIDCVYSSRLKLFFALTNDRKLETWVLGDLSSPKLIKVDETNINQGHFYSLFHTFVPFICEMKEHLVVVKDDLLLVIQYIMDNVGPDGSYCDNLDKHYSLYMTIGFDIFKYDDSEKGKFEYLDSSSLGDLAIFVGSHSHSVAIQATEFLGVKPNSVYFTDGMYTGTLEGDEWFVYFEEFCCGHDIGIYNYQDKTVSPCYYPCDVPSVKTILPAPIWFFPN